MSLGTEQNPLRVAIIGAGPSGFYASEALIRSDLNVEIDLTVISEENDYID